MSAPPAGFPYTLAGLERIVLDASFVIALLEGEQAATDLIDVLPRSELTAVTAGEVFYKTTARSGLDAAETEATLTGLGARLVDLRMDAARHFPDLRAIDTSRRAEQRANGEPGAVLSLADLCVLGHAAATNLTVLTGDRHWSTLTAHGLTVPIHQFRTLTR